MNLPSSLDTLSLAVVPPDLLLSLLSMIRTTSNLTYAGQFPQFSWLGTVFIDS